MGRIKTIAAGHRLSMDILICNLGRLQPVIGKIHRGDQEIFETKSEISGRAKQGFKKRHRMHKMSPYMSKYIE
jgi:hypothetical protein